MTFLTMADNLGQPITFGVYAGLCLFGLIFNRTVCPRDKGATPGGNWGAFSAAILHDLVSLMTIVLCFNFALQSWCFLLL